MKKNILIASLIGVLLLGGAMTFSIINTQQWERQECVEGYRFYATMRMYNSEFTVDVYEATNMCDAYRGIGAHTNYNEEPKCYDVKKEGHDFYVYHGSAWRLLVR